MAKHKIVCVATWEPDSILFEEYLSGIDYDLTVHMYENDDKTIEAIKDANVIINMGVPMSREVMQTISKSEAIVSWGHGFDFIDDKAATEMGIMIVNITSAIEEVSNHAIVMVLGCAKQLTVLHERTKRGEWDDATSLDQGVRLGDIDGETLGLVGFGNIARATARKAKVFGLDIIAYDPYVQPWISKEYRVEMVKTMEELASRSDYVSMHLPLKKATHHIIGDKFFESMKPTAYLINTCRGPTVNEKALITALQNKEIAGAALDVFEEEPTPKDNPLLKMENVMVTPHTAGTSVSYEAGVYKLISQETARLLKGMWPMSVVNPSVLSKLPPRLPAADV